MLNVPDRVWRGVEDVADLDGAHAEHEPAGADPAEHLPLTPWGDQREFDRVVWAPLRGEPPLDDPRAVRATVPAEDVERLRQVLGWQGEAYAGAVPWQPPDEGRARRRRAAAS